MALDQKQKWCSDCNRNTLHIRTRMSEGWGCLLTILTAGLFLPVWIIMSLFGTFSGWHCQACGAKN